MKNLLTQSEYSIYEYMLCDILLECERIYEQSDAEIERRIHYETERLAYYRSREEALAQSATRGAFIGAVTGGVTNIISGSKGKGIADDTVAASFVGAGVSMAYTAITRQLEKIREQKRLIAIMHQRENDPAVRQELERNIKSLTLKELIIANKLHAEKLKKIKR